ncbi:MAG: LysR family transcriptional regulator [Polyangiaceae bacterium]|nr:LysR family transcriptional regulator [Polyangiaceae bacterium]MCB9606882.1 LysR family transcriptional regulator [Polyangiaceae bacterium]
MDLEALRIFLKVAEVQSLTRAGEHLGLPKAHVSRKLAALESDLDTRLFHRSTRVVRLTPDGETLIPRARSIVREADEVSGMFRTGRRLRGRVRVDMPVALARNRVLPALPQLLERHPELELFISTTDRIVDVVGEGFDCVLRVGASSDLDVTQKKLGELSVLNCVSRGYVERRGIPKSLEDLDQHQLVHYASRLGTDAPMFEYVRDGKTHFRAMASSVTVNTSDAYSAACVAGLGMVQVPRIGMTARLASGEVVDVLPDFRCAPMPVVILQTHGRRPPQRVRAVMDWIMEALRGQLE